MTKVKRSIEEQIVDEIEVIQPQSKSSFIEANTIKVDLNHLKEKCIIPVFSKDNETTISHYQFINQALETIRKHFPNAQKVEPEIRVSHMVKGRIPSAIGKPAKDLLEEEKTLYYERCAFLIKLPIEEIVNGNRLAVTVGGVRAYNQENLYNKKSVEKFKVFIGYQNKVCTNLCISTDGFCKEVRITAIEQLENAMLELFFHYDADHHLKEMRKMGTMSISEIQFAHLIGKLRMYQYLDKAEQRKLFPFQLNDGQLNSVVRDFYHCPNFSKEADNSISLWKLYNLFTEANKSSYIDSSLERNVNVGEFVNYLGKSLENGQKSWFLI